MQKPLLLIMLTSIFISLSGCNSKKTLPTTPQPGNTVTQEIIPTLTSTKLMPTITATASYPPEIHLTLPSGLTIDEYTLKGAPSTEPLSFSPYRWTKKDILDEHLQERSESFPDNSFFDDNMYYSMSVEWNNQKLVAREVYTTTHVLPPEGIVDVLLDNKLIYTVHVGDGSPINSLRGLWAYNQHWILETAYITSTYIETTNERTTTATGQIAENGESLNKRYSYQETFGFQLIKGKPFYFFKKDGEIDISYDGQITPLGYTSIPHYGCCSVGELNPRPAKNMMSFFAQKNGVWYYVEIGVYGQQSGLTPG